MEAIRRGATLLVLVAALRAAGQPAPEPPRIGSITIRCRNTFTEEEARGSKLYRAMNGMRTVTRPAAIRRHLLFAPGDPLDPERLAETERNLRQLPFLKSARVTAGEPRDGEVDVLVETQDSWTLVPALPLASAGGTTTYGFTLAETDLFGSGRGLAFRWEKGIERIVRAVEYDDPWLFDSEYRAHMLLASNSDGWRGALSVERPFRTTSAVASERFRADLFSQVTYSYQAQEVQEAWRQEHRSFALGAAHALVAGEGRAVRVTTAAEWLDDRFALLPERPGDVLPAARAFRFLVAGWALVEPDLLRWNYVNRDLRVEDFDLGTNLSVQVGVSPPILGADGTTGLLRASASRGARAGSRGFLLGRASFETRWRGGVENGLLSTSLDFVWKLPARHPMTFVAKGRWDKGWNLDRDVQLVADGLTGLRGYRLFSYTGSERVIVNAEQRFFSGKELMHLFSPGLALFVDAGDASSDGLRPKADVGIGFRMAIARAPQDNVYRIDVAWPLSPDPKGRRGLLVSFSAAQGF